LRDIGLMDETFGAYVEDTDWSYRARLLKWTSVFTPVPSIIHHEEPHGYEHYSVKSFLLKRNTVYWYLKFGMRRQAQAYSVAAVALARWRAKTAVGVEARRASREFADRLSSVYGCLLRGTELGAWFGPPISGSDVESASRTTTGRGFDAA
jgi:GT2 family glycosyltransferase